MPDPRELILNAKPELVELSQGNPGCLQLMCTLIEKFPENHREILDGIREMGFQGPRLWLAYKDILGCDLEGLALQLLEKDPAFKERVYAIPY